VSERWRGSVLGDCQFSCGGLRSSAEWLRRASAQFSSASVQQFRADKSAPASQQEAVVTTTVAQHVLARLRASGAVDFFGAPGDFGFPVKLTVRNGAIVQSNDIHLATTRKQDKRTVFSPVLKTLRADERLPETHMQLAHMNDAATMGQLTASIANEVTAAVINAGAALRWLSAERPDLEEAKQALGRILENGNRGSEVIDRIRGLIENAP